MREPAQRHGDPANVSDRASKCASVRGVVTESSEAYELSNVVESALARALLLAAEAGRWEPVGRIAVELDGRRTGAGCVPGSDESVTVTEPG